MKLLEKQFKFTFALHHLIKFAFENGYFLTVGDAYRDPRVKYGHEKSNHRKRLAIDLNLFIDGEYITDGNHGAWLILHQEAERLGMAPMIKRDPNHFSMLHNGMR